LKRVLLLFILLVFADSFIDAQVVSQDSTYVGDTTVIKHSPRKAVFMSLVPGAGQIYNQKYWKVPIIYAAIGTLTYFIIDYNKKYKTFVHGYNDFMSKDPTRTSYLNIRGYENYSQDPQFYLKGYRDFYRRWRDLDVLILAGVYVLNIIDANVDAHFFNFEIDDDISLNVKPYIFEPFHNSKNMGLSLNIKF